MTKQKFGNRFTDDDFMTEIPENILITPAGVSRRVGCSHETARTRLAQLEEQGKLRRVEIVDGRDAVWMRVTDDEKNSKDSEDRDLLNEMIGSEGWFTATVHRTGTYEGVIKFLLHNIRADGRRPVADRIWVPICQALIDAQLRKGDCIEFYANYPSRYNFELE